jgi:hypothetical protein
LKSLNINIFYSLIVFYLIAISWSPILSSLTSFSASLFYAPIVILLIILLWYSERIKINSFLMIIFFLLLVLFITIFKDTLVYAQRFAFFSIVLLLIILILKKESIINYTSKILTVYIIIAIIFSIISFIYAYLGFSPIFEINNPDGRINYLYLMSFSNSIFGNIIRPSFIYDEPGAFSFIICYVVILRTMLKKNKNITLLILIGGLITFSVTHIIILLIYLILEINKKIIFLLIPILIIISILLSNQDELKFFFDRFSLSESGEIKADNRSGQINNFIKIANQEIILFGNYQCEDSTINKCTDHYDMTSSPITPIYYGGILFLFVQLLTSILLLWIGYKNKNFRFVGLVMFLLLLQRPFYSAKGYQIMIYTTLFYSMRKTLQQKKKNIHYITKGFNYVK